VAMKKYPLVAKWRSPLVARYKYPPRVRRVDQELRAPVVTVKEPTTHRHHRGVPLKSARDRMDIISASQQVGSYRAAAELCGTTHKTVKRVVEKFETGGTPPARVERAHGSRRLARSHGCR
jgi:hypothetical protein